MINFFKRTLLIFSCLAYEGQAGHITLFNDDADPRNNAQVVLRALSSDQALLPLQDVMAVPFQELLMHYLGEMATDPELRGKLQEILFAREQKFKETIANISARYEAEWQDLPKGALEKMAEISGTGTPMTTVASALEELSSQERFALEFNAALVAYASMQETATRMLSHNSGSARDVWLLHGLQAQNQTAFGQLFQTLSAVAVLPMTAEDLSDIGDAPRAFFQCGKSYMEQFVEIPEKQGRALAALHEHYARQDVTSYLMQHHFFCERGFPLIEIVRRLEIVARAHEIRVDEPRGKDHVLIDPIGEALAQVIARSVKGAAFDPDAVTAQIMEFWKGDPLDVTRVSKLLQTAGRDYGVLYQSLCSNSPDLPVSPHALIRSTLATGSCQHYWGGSKIFGNEWAIGKIWERITNPVVDVEPSLIQHRSPWLMHGSVVVLHFPETEGITPERLEVMDLSGSLAALKGHSTHLVSLRGRGDDQEDPFETFPLKQGSVFAVGAVTEKGLLNLRMKAVDGIPDRLLGTLLRQSSGMHPYHSLPVFVEGDRKLAKTEVKRRSRGVSVTAATLKSLALSDHAGPADQVGAADAARDDAES